MEELCLGCKQSPPKWKGLCQPCYGGAMELVESKETTWTELGLMGLASVPKATLIKRFRDMRGNGETTLTWSKFSAGEGQTEGNNEVFPSRGDAFNAMVKVMKLCDIHDHIDATLETPDGNTEIWRGNSQDIFRKYL